jgi:putative ABC transport system permease protein
VLLFAGAVSLLVGLVFGLAPLAGVLRPQLYGALRDGGRTLGDRAGAGLRRNIVIAETALAVVLLAGALLLARSFIALNGVDPGYRTENLLTFRLSPSSTRYAEEERVVAFYEQLAGQLAALPGVAGVSAVSNLPLNNPLGDLNFEIEGRPVPQSAVSPRADWQAVLPGYFDAMGMQLVRGRAIDERDRIGAPGAVVINEAVAERYFAGQDPIGQRFTLGGGAGPGLVTIVGIVRNVRHASLAARPKPEMYIPHAQFRFWNGGSIVRALTVVVRTDADPSAITTAAREAVARIDPDVPLSGLRTMDDVVAGSVASRRFLTTLLLAFAGVALALSAIGTYGVLAYGVARRANEMGVRMALGARPSAVARMVIADGMTITAIGLALGLLGALAATRLLESMLYGVHPNDPVTLIAVTVVLGAVALTACAVPALKATRIDPLHALRQE